MDWIPIKKEYPKDKQKVLFTVQTSSHGYFILNGTYRKLVDPETGEITNIFRQYAYKTNYAAGDYRVTAWMPSPEPYNTDFRVIVAGGRTFDDYNLMTEKLDYAFSNLDKRNIIILCGEAKGADRFGKQYAKEHGIWVESYPADWEREGSAAGYERNERMADNAKALIAFWNGRSAGTKHMIDTAKRKGLQIKIVRYTEKV